MFTFKVIHGRVHVSGFEGRIPARLEVPKIMEGKPVWGIDPWAFANAHDLEELVLPEGLEKLGWYALSGCRRLLHVELPQSLTSIEGSAFQNCISLEKLILPASMEDIGAHFVEGCHALEELDVSPDNVRFKQIKGILYTKDGKVLVCAPPGWSGEYRSEMELEEISGEAFWGCKKVKGINLGESVSKVGNHAFYGCPIKEIVLSEGIEETGEWAFGRGAYLENLSLPLEELPDAVLAGLRRCLEGRNLRFFQGTARAMDRIFSERQRMELLFSFIIGEMPLNEDGAKVYESLVGKNLDKMFQMIFERDGAQGLGTMEKLGYLDMERVSALQEKASERHATHCMLYLLEYLNRHGGEQLKDKWDIDF